MQTMLNSNLEPAILMSNCALPEEFSTLKNNSNKKTPKMKKRKRETETGFRPFPRFYRNLVMVLNYVC